MLRVLIIAAAVLMVLAISVMAFGNSTAMSENTSPSILLEKGIFEEETKGDLDAAVKIYQQIIENEKANRRYVAEAHYRTGMCLLKKGEKEKAAEFFRKVVSLFPNQTQLVTEASKQLSGIYPVAGERLPLEVLMWIVDKHMEAYEQGQAKGLLVNTHIYGVDDEFNKYQGGFLTYTNKRSETIFEEIPLGNFGRKRPDFELVDEQGVTQKFRLEERETTSRGKYRLWWKPDKPIQPGQMRLLGYLNNKKTQKLPQIKGQAQLKMNNHFGSPVLENFFLVVPANVAIVKESRDHIAHERRGIFDIYLYQREVPADTTNEVNVALKKTAIEKPTAFEPLELESAPWPDGEILNMYVDTKAGMRIGMVRYVTELVTTARPDSVDAVQNMPFRNRWKVQSYMVLPTVNMRQYTDVQARLPDFAPIFGRTKNQSGDYLAIYGDREIRLEVTRGTETTVRSVPTNTTVFDNEQALFLIRRMPLKEGYEASFPIFSPQSGSIFNCKIKVTGKETIPGMINRPMECHKVNLTIRHQGTVAMQHTVWFSTDPHRWPIKYDSGAAVMRLWNWTTTKLEKAKFEQPWDVTKDLSLKKHPGWHFYLDTEQKIYKFQVHMLPPELKAWATFIGNAVPVGLDSPRKAAEVDIEILKGFFEDYHVREDSWEEVHVYKMPGVRYVADYKKNGVNMVEYRTYLTSKAMVFWFVFRIEKDQFDANKTEFDSIVLSLGPPRYKHIVVNLGPLKTAEMFIEKGKAGQKDECFALIRRGFAGKVGIRQVEALSKIVDLEITEAYASEKNCLVFTSFFTKPSRPDKERRIVLELSWQEDGWKVDDLGVLKEEVAIKYLDLFKKKNPKARLIEPSANPVRRR